MAESVPTRRYLAANAVALAPFPAAADMTGVHDFPAFIEC
jgi:hypothetical protein